MAELRRDVEDPVGRWDPTLMRRGYLDIETTGLSPRTAQLTVIGLYIEEGGKSPHPLSTLRESDLLLVVETRTLPGRHRLHL